ncbi:MAG: ATPase [Planctomycetota bacterium]|nr:MAG: ATPase [Planctomycetota bacterium]
MRTSGQLQISLPSDREILFVREFRAPRQLVWDCHTKPELLKRWVFGPDGWSMPHCEVDLRVGGRYRYVWKHTRGTEMGMGGVFKEIAAPSRLVATELFDEDWTGGEVIATHEFTEKHGITTLRLVAVYSSKEARDGALKSGMTDGMEMSYARVDAMVAEGKT